MQKVFIGVACLLLAAGSTAQIPHLTGTVRIEQRKGLMTADVTIQNLPEAGDYRLWLNSGLTLTYIQDPQSGVRHIPDRFYDRNNSYEAFQYFLVEGGQKAALPPALRWLYQGAFPVFDRVETMTEWEDWMGNMAFNGKTLRASNQSAWYPILFDATSGKIHDRYTYELTVHCPDCEAIYLSGSAPVYGQSATFKSQEAAHLLLFAGQFAFEEWDHMYFINTGLSEASKASLGALKSDIIAHYEQWLQIPYGGDLTLVATSSSALKPGFSFVSYPTVVFVGNNENTWDIGTLFDPQTGQFKDQSIRFLAHEIAHYYVGTYFKPNGPLFWGFNEGLTEYLAASYLKRINREALYLPAVRAWMNQAAGIENFVPIAEVESAEQLAFDAYRYHYMPLLLTIMEREFGQDAMDQWVRLLLQRRSATIDLAYWRESALQLPVSAAVWDNFEQRFLTDQQSREQALRYGESHFLPAPR